MEVFLGFWVHAWRGVCWGVTSSLYLPRVCSYMVVWGCLFWAMQLVAFDLVVIGYSMDIGRFLVGFLGFRACWVLAGVCLPVCVSGLDVRCLWLIFMVYVW